MDTWIQLELRMWANVTAVWRSPSRQWRYSPKEGCSQKNVGIEGAVRGLDFYGNMDLFYEVNLLNNTQLEPIAKGKGT